MLGTLTLWHVEVAIMLLIIIIVNLGSLDLVEVYTVLRKDFTDYWFMLIHHLV